MADSTSAKPPRSRAIKVIFHDEDVDALDAAVAALPVAPTSSELVRTATRIGLRQILGGTPIALGIDVSPRVRS